MTKTIDIIYDGDCGFCQRAISVLRALDVGHRLRFHNSRGADIFDQFPTLRGADLFEAMYAVVPGEPAYRGFFAFRRLIWSNPTTWLLIPLFYFPGAGVIGPRIYAWVARNRNQLGCRTNVCDVSSLPRA